MNALFRPIILTLTLLTSLCSGQCPPAGPILPIPPIPSDFNLTGLSSLIDSTIHSVDAPWNISTTSFSVEITSPKETFFRYHHTASIRHGNGTDEVDSNTVYRVASVTKAFNVLTLLLNARGHLDSPIAQFVPELEGIDVYEDITLRMLAGSLSGVSRDGVSFPMQPFVIERILTSGGIPQGTALIFTRKTGKNSRNWDSLPLPRRRSRRVTLGWGDCAPGKVTPPRQANPHHEVVKN